MVTNLSLFDKPISIDCISIELNSGKQVAVDVLRLDTLHDTISGNKCFKLKYNLLAAQEQGADTIISFGGAYSNHLHALAYACKLFGIKAIGMVRGEDVENPTLTDCKNWGMELRFISRTDYRKKTEPDFLDTIQAQYPNSFIIPEGGDNALGQKGCTEILDRIDTASYDLLCCSIGTGTTLSGLAASFKKEIWGFAPFKNAHSLKEQLTNSISKLQYIDAYNFGGFGKVSDELLHYMQLFKDTHQIELDRVYTSKMFWGLENSLNENVTLQDKKILVVHTGGLQGNRSSNS